MQWLSDWWNDVELWVAQLPFWLQFALVMVILVPLCTGVAWAIDRIVDYVSATLGPARRNEPPLDVSSRDTAEADAASQKPAS